MGISEKEMRKQMEMGAVFATDVLPKVAKEYAKAARENGALEKAQVKVNSQFQRFLNALTDIKIAMFEGGMGKSLADSFQIMAKFLQDNREGFAALGNTIGSAIKTVVAVLQVALEPIMVVVKAFNAMFGDSGAKILGAVVAVTALQKAVAMLAATFAIANLGWMTLVKNIVKYGVITGAVLALEDIYVGSKGGNSYSKEMGLNATLDSVAASRIGQILTSPVRVGRSLMNGNNPFILEVKVNDGEFSKAITTRIQQNSEDQMANTAAQLGG
jgi:hypothetical protein